MTPRKSLFSLMATVFALLSPLTLAGAAPGLAPALPAPAPVPAPGPAPPPIRAPAPARALAASLHLDGVVSSAVCGKRLEFSITVTNSSATPFQGDAWLRISGGTLASDPKFGGPLMSRVVSVPANGQQTFKFVGNATDCLSKQTFLAVLLGNQTGPLAVWDRQAVELTTTPPTDCRATTSQRKYPWNPKA